MGEGFVDVTGGRVWYKVVGEGDATPLVTLHGGPGWPHDSLEPLKELADERPVVFYDQLGCGKSDRPDDSGLWRIERFVQELEAVRKSLGFEQIDILGHSWGTMLAVDYVLENATRVEKLVLASPALSATRWEEDNLKYVNALPQEARDVLLLHEAGETVDKETFDAAYNEFSKRHFCRIEPHPEPMQRAGQGFGGIVYQTMWGNSELSANGNLKDYERVDRLRNINIPVLFTCGEYDEATPESSQYYADHMPDAQVVVFKDCAHVPHFEAQDDYIRIVRNFLR